MATVYWITGLSGVGKTPLSKELHNKISEKEPVVLIDGDKIREILGNTSATDRESRLKISYVYSNLAKVIVSQNINVICSTISLFHEIHSYNRSTFKEYKEIFIKKNIETLIDEDKNGIYSKSLQNKEFVVGINIEPEYPKDPSIILDFNLSQDLGSIVENILKL
tara:strand:- start:62 stop:556 length:495 start_codon:yes stop_codon:yes gene_type:complete